MKRLNHEEYQLVVNEEVHLLKEHLQVARGKPGNTDYLAKVAELEELKAGGTTCLGCTLGKSLPHEHKL